MTDGAIILAIFFVWVYVLPMVVAICRKHHNATSIVVLNLFLGWTFLGWVVALVWAFSSVPVVLLSTSLPSSAAMPVVRRHRHPKTDAAINQFLSDMSKSDLRK